MLGQLDGSGNTPKQLKFTFSVVSDDGNLPAALVAGASDLLVQLNGGSTANCATMYSCMLMLHEGPPSEENPGASSFTWLIDPTLEETQNLSNNLMMVTLLRRPGSSRADMEIDQDSEMQGDGDGGSDPIMVEKASDTLRTCYNMQLASALSFKPVTMSLAHLRQGMAVGKEVTTKLAASYESQ